MFATKQVKLLCKVQSWRPILAPRMISVSINIDGRFMTAQKPSVEKLPNEVQTPWKLCASVCLTRPPLLEPLKEEIELKYAQLAEAKELAKSCLSDWETEKIRQNFIVKQAEAAGDAKKVTMDFRETFQDIEDQNDSEHEKFLESRKELIPDENDLKQILRSPRETLLLILQQKLGNDTVWMLPMCEWRAGETLRMSAERALATDFGPEAKASFVSNAPSGFYKYKFPKEARDERFVGAKLFIYNAYIPRAVERSIVPNIKLTPDKERVLDYAWITRSEMAKYLKPKYTQAIQDILL